MSGLQRLLARGAVAAVVLGTAVSGVNASIYNVNGGERAIIWARFGGLQKGVKGEGTHFLIPGLQKPYIFDVKTRPRVINTTTGSKDLQIVNLTLRILSKPSIDHLPWLFDQYGLDYDERILPSICNEVMKDVVAQYDASELITRREFVSSEIRTRLMQRAADFHVNLDDVAITSLSFGAEFSRAIERKQVAEQEAERAKYVVVQAEQEKQAAIIRAQGESEAATLISAAIAEGGEGFIELRRIEAAREISGTLSGSRNVVYLPSTSNVLMQLSKAQ